MGSDTVLQYSNLSSHCYSARRDLVSWGRQLILREMGRFPPFCALAHRLRKIFIVIVLLVCRER